MKQLTVVKGHLGKSDYPCRHITNVSGKLDGAAFCAPYLQIIPKNCPYQVLFKESK